MLHILKEAFFIIGILAIFCGIQYSIVRFIILPYLVKYVEEDDDIQKTDSDNSENMV